MPDFLAEVTPVVLTGDEEANIGRTLAQLGWAREVLVVDSESTDRTREIATSFPNVRLLTRPFDDFASQWNHAISLVTTAWLLALDADYFVTDAFAAAVDALAPAADVAGYEAPFVYAINGRPLRGALYPPHAVLVRRAASTFVMDGHAYRVRVAGRVERLRAPIVHDDRKNLRRFLARQRRYMRDEAAKLRATPWRSLNAAGRIRKMRVVAPFAAAMHALVVKRTLLDGPAGWRYALERFLAEIILSRELFRSAPAEPRSNGAKGTHSERSSHRP